MTGKNLIEYEFGSFSREVPESEREAYINRWKSTVLKQNCNQPYRNEATLGLITDAFQENTGSPLTYFASPKKTWDLNGEYNGPMPSFESESGGSDLDRAFRKETEGQINEAIRDALRNEMQFLRILSAPYEPDHAVQFHLYFQDAYQNFHGDGDGVGSIVGLGASSPDTEPYDILHYGGESVFRIGDELDDKNYWMWGEDSHRPAGVAVKKTLLRVLPRWDQCSEYGINELDGE